MKIKKIKQLISEQRLRIEKLEGQLSLMEKKAEFLTDRYNDFGLPFSTNFQECLRRTTILDEKLESLLKNLCIELVPGDNYVIKSRVVAPKGV